MRDTEQVELEPGVFLLPKARVIRFEKARAYWPLPRPDLDNAARHSELDLERRLALSSVLSAYEQMVFTPHDKRQRIVGVLRKALHWMAEHEQEACGAEAPMEERRTCMVCDAPARPRDCGGYDDFCSDDCELQHMEKLAKRYAEQKKAPARGRRPGR